MRPLFAYGQKVLWVLHNRTHQSKTPSNIENVGWGFKNTLMITKCSQEHVFHDHDDQKLAIVKYNLESFQNLTLNGNTDIIGTVCQPHNS